MHGCCWKNDASSNSPVIGPACFLMVETLPSEGGSLLAFQRALRQLGNITPCVFYAGTVRRTDEDAVYNMKTNVIEMLATQ